MMFTDLNCVAQLTMGYKFDRFVFEVSCERLDFRYVRYYHFAN